MRPQRWISDGIRTTIKMENDAYKELLRSAIRQGHCAYVENLTT